MAGMLGQDLEDDFLQFLGCSTAYSIELIAGQAAISTDFDMVASCFCYNNRFVREATRHNVWTTRAKIVAIAVIPDPERE
eukprot:7883073-Karenia_brevis.AAC.1